MKVDVNQVMAGPDGPRKRIVQKVDEKTGLPVVEGGGYAVESKGDLLLQHVLIDAVNASYKGEELTHEDVAKRGRLVRRFRRGGEISLSAEEVVLVTKLIGKRYQHDPELASVAMEIMDPDKFGEKAEKA